MRRVDIKAILADPEQRRRLMVGVIVATQAREGIETTAEQAAEAYDRVAARRAPC
jgi:hypothetical protein